MKRPRLSLKELLKKRELNPDKKAELEKGDFLALLLAALSVFLPVVLGFMAFFILITVLFLR